ncbi:MAG: hypothetical protein ABUL60_29530 [Myxococcales bacterium]
MQHTTTTPADSNAHPPRKISGFFEIDVRAGFERAVRDATENALKCYREAAKARAAGDELEALGLCELAEQSLDLARATLCRIESL